ncbi:MAG: M50 family metallopeptidase, partial [Bacteroidota bacterium]
GIFLVFLWFAIVLGMRLLSTTLHELGHAIPALLYTKEPVKVFIGSYGEEQGSWRLSLGRLSFFFKPRFLAWNLGMCSSTGKMNTQQRAIMLLGGPLASVIVAGLALWAIVTFKFGEVEIIIVSAFLLSAIWDLIVNLVPRASNIGFSLDQHQPLLSDGTQLLMLWRYHRQSPELKALTKKLEDKEYEEVVTEVERRIAEGNAPLGLYGLAIDAYTAMKEYGGALSIYEALHKRYPLQGRDLAEVAALYAKLGNYREAINCYDAYLHDAFTDVSALHGRGWAYQQMGEHERAIVDFSVCLERDPMHATARRDRAFSYFRLSKLEEASQDLSIAAQLAPDHPRYHLYLGFYLEAIGDYVGAHNAILKAQELGDNHHGIPFKLNELESYF